MTCFTQGEVESCAGTQVSQLIVWSLDSATTPLLELSGTDGSTGPEPCSSLCSPPGKKWGHVRTGTKGLPAPEHWALL